MEVASIFLCPLLQVLFDKLASRVLLDFSSRQRIRSRLDKLKDNLDMISQVIARADNMVVREKGVDGWLEEVRDWAYDADDFLDEVNTRAMQEEEVEARRNNSSGSISVSSFTRAFVTKVRDLGSRFNPGKYSEDVDELNSRLDAISERMRKMHSLTKMIATDNTSTPPMPMLQRPLEATAHAFDARVFGREQEKEKIIEQLKGSRDTDVEVIPIVGMPGIGKTTLARHVFHSVQQQQQQPPIFDITGWVCVSDDYDVNRITRDILESFTYRASDLRGLNQLQSQLKKVVRGKRFLLVLDDVWTRNYCDWNDLLSPFGVGAPGSKILVTTRDDRVASMMQTDHPMKIHHLGTLCDDDCWSVFLQHVVAKRRPVFESEAVRFRVKILEKCKGLPLAAKLLAGLLRGESPGQGWEAKLNSSIWENDVGLSGRKGNRMLPVVMLSYFHLPPQLKCCFSYCSVIPEDYEFGEEEVVMRWIAQGLVLAEKGEQVEVTGAKYFRELVSRSLFQPSPNNPSQFLMHDLINEMAEIVAGKSCLKLDRVPKIDSSTVKARYSSYRSFSGVKTEFEAFETTIYLRDFQSFCHTSSYVPLELLMRLKYLRVLSLSGHSVRELSGDIGESFRHTGGYANLLTSYVSFELLMKLKYLRVLCLSGYCVRELPRDIGDLIHLRLVDLSYTYIRELPESTCRLYNLLALRLQGCQRLRTLPAEMRKLVNLRNLDCSGVNRLEAMPVEMGKLTSLQKLSNFIVGKGLGQGVGELKGLSHLKGSISISFLENVHDSKEAKEAKLMSKEGLRSLELKWNSGDGDLQGTVLTELQPHRHLEKLIINGYGGLRFPGWVGDDSFSKMRVIVLANCGKCTSLPPLGKLPVLEEIEIRNMAGIECVGEEFYGKEGGAFPSLNILKFELMENWSTWLYPAAGGCRFACLQELHVIRCPKLLLSLPVAINVQKLNVRKCDALLIALPRHSILELTIRDCKVEFMECLEDDEGASELLPSVSRLNIEKVDAVEVVGSAGARMNITSNKHVVEAHHQMMMFHSLTALEITSIPKLTYLPGVVLHGLPKLEKLNIRRCEELKSLWKRVDGEMEMEKSEFLKSLRVLDVEECRQLVCLDPLGGEEDNNTDRDTDISGEEEEEEEEEVEEEKRGKQQCQGLPCGLESLRLTKCNRLEKLPSDMHNLTSLRWLDIRHCKRLSCLPEMGFPSTLQLLGITNCESLTCLSSSSSSMRGNGMPLPQSLQWLRVESCKNLESLVSAAFTSADSFPSLQSLRIYDCPKLKSLPECIYRRLKGLAITGCENLGEPPISVHHLPALEDLWIDGCPAGLLCIQQGGPNPNSLLPNLRSLRIEGVAGTMTPNDEELFSVPLPSSLTSLSISKFNNLSPEAFENLTSLEELRIWDCPGLTSIPDQWLPPSLLSLRIWDCPLLAHEFAKGKGRYWPKVKFIPEVEINHRSIFDLEEEEEE